MNRAMTNSRDPIIIMKPYLIEVRIVNYNIISNLVSKLSNQSTLQCQGDGS